MRVSLLRRCGPGLIPASTRSATASLRVHFLSFATSISPFLAQQPQQPSSLHKLVSQPPSRKMSNSAKPASNDMYAAFLEQANRDPNEGVDDTTATTAAAAAEKSITPRTLSEGQAIPACLTSVEAYHVSDADEQFIPFALEFPGARNGLWPTTDQFQKLIFPEMEEGQANTVFGISTSAFEMPDAFRSAHSQVVEAVEASASTSKGECRAYRVDYGPPRFEYWIAALDRLNERIVGMKALAIES